MCEIAIMLTVTIVTSDEVIIFNKSPWIPSQYSARHDDLISYTYFMMLSPVSPM